MAKTNIPCPDCGRPLNDTRGLGERSQELVCGYIGCPSNNRHHRCPQCDSTEKLIGVLGLSDKIFRCNDCGFEWRKTGP